MSNLQANLVYSVISACIPWVILTWVMHACYCSQGHDPMAHGSLSTLCGASKVVVCTKRPTANAESVQVHFWNRPCPVELGLVGKSERYVQLTHRPSSYAEAKKTRSLMYSHGCLSVLSKLEGTALLYQDNNQFNWLIFFTSSLAPLARCYLTWDPLGLLITHQTYHAFQNGSLASSRIHVLFCPMFHLSSFVVFNEVRSLVSSAAGLDVIPWPTWIIWCPVLSYRLALKKCLVYGYDSYYAPLATYDQDQYIAFM